MTRTFSFPSIGRFVVLLFCLIATPVFAQEAENPEEPQGEEEEGAIQGAYLEYSAGVAVVPNQNLRVRGSEAKAVLQSGDFKSETGYVIGAAAGVRFLDHFRGELAVNYRRNDVEDMSISGSPTRARGEISLISTMVNAYAEYDLDLGIIPYFGLGIGYGYLQMDAKRKDSDLKINDEESVFVWNVMVGGAIPIGETVTLTTGYRYMQTTDPKFKSRNNPNSDGTFNGRNLWLDSEYDSHEFLAGMRVNF